MPSREPIPVYVFTGFLESGKTQFIKEIIADPDFTENERTALLLCEEGIEEFEPDVIHLASPTILGGRAMVAAQKAGVPTVAVYQTDIPGFTARYGMSFLESASWQLLRDVHNRASLTLAPSTATRDQMLEHGIELVDFKLEFGRLPDGTIVLADEISPDTCRFWDVETHEKLDKDRFRRDLSGVEDAYQEVMRRLIGE